MEIKTRFSVGDMVWAARVERQEGKNARCDMCGGDGIARDYLGALRSAACSKCVGTGFLVGVIYKYVVKGPFKVCCVLALANQSDGSCAEIRYDLGGMLVGEDSVFESEELAQGTFGDHASDSSLEVSVPVSGSAHSIAQSFLGEERNDR